MGEIAYAVRPEYADAGFEGGALAVGDGDAFHVGEQLKKGHGYLVVDESDGTLMIRLDEQPALVRVPVEKARKARETKPKKGDA